MMSTRNKQTSTYNRNKKSTSGTTTCIRYTKFLPILSVHNKAMSSLYSNCI